MATLKLLISADGKSVTKDPDIFHAGPPRSEVTIVVVNGDGTNGHELELVKIKHLPTGNHKDPLTGPKKWRTPPGGSDDSQHKVKDDADIGRYSYVVKLDEGELSDPEIVVDPPFGDEPKKEAPKRPAPKKRAKAAPKGRKKRTAKRKPAKKKTAKKKARRR
jgi:hypothetical protein